MSLSQRVKKYFFDRYNYWKIKKRIPDSESANFVRRHWINNDHVEWVHEKKSLHIKGTEIELKKDKNLFLIIPHNQIEELFILKKELNIRFYEQENKLFGDLGHLKLNIQTGEELLIIREIYLEGIYNFVPKSKFVVLDIGMNVGYSSLYFASSPLCEKVYSFEPFLPTYKQALFNISQNASLQDKIVPFNYGLSNRNEEVEVNYSPSNRGSMSVEYWPDFANKSNDTQVEKIQIRNVIEVFSEIGIDNLQGVQVIAKIDCEGAEYAIIDQLWKTGLLNKIDVIMMEWHLKGTTELINKLNYCGFQSFDLKPFDKYQGKYGFIYAVKTGYGHKA